MKIAFIISGTICIIAILILNRPNNIVDLKKSPSAALHFEEVQQRTLQPIVQITGKLQPVRTARIHFQIAGQINQRLIEAGQFVTAGSVLLRIDNGDFVDAVTESKGLLEMEKSAIERNSILLDLMTQEVALQQQEVARLKQLGQDALASTSNYEQALQRLYQQQAEQARLKHSLDTARTQLLVEQAKLSKALRNLQRATLVAPFAGTINQTHVDVGDYISPGQAAVEMVQVKQLDLLLEVTGAVSTKLVLGQTINISTDQDRREGEIIALAAEPDPNTNTYALKIRMDSKGLYPGQLAIAHLPGRLYEAVHIIPIGAVLYEDGQAYVFELVGNQIRRRSINLIERYKEVYIVDGIAVGTKIVSKDVTSLADGQTVLTD